MEFKEISITEINDYMNSFDLFSKGAICLADDKTEVNGLTIGWGALGILWSKPCLTVYVNEVRYTRHILDNANGFSVCFFNEKYNDELKYFGTVSGKNENKIKNTSLTLDYIDDIPYFKESSLVIICNKLGQSKFDINHINIPRIVSWYKQDGVHTCYYGEIVKVLKK